MAQFITNETDTTLRYREIIARYNPICIIHVNFFGFENFIIIATNICGTFGLLTQTKSKTDFVL